MQLSERASSFLMANQQSSTYWNATIRWQCGCWWHISLNQCGCSKSRPLYYCNGWPAAGSSHIHLILVFNQPSMTTQPGHPSERGKISAIKSWGVKRHTTWCRAPIDQLFSRESSASINLVGDRSVDPACDHVPAYHACHPCNQMLSSGMNQHPTTVPARWPAAIWHSWQPCWLDDSAPTPLLTPCSSSSRPATLQDTLCGHTLPVWLALSQLVSVSVV